MTTFADFYRDHKDRLLGYLLKMTADYELSCDIMQESFTRCMERYPPKKLTPALLFTIARNTVFDNSRRNRPQAYADLQRLEIPSNPEADHLVREAYQRAIKTMQQLEPDEKELLSLVSASVCSYREIARQVGISEANVKVKVHRARIKLKKLLEQGDKHE